MSGKYAIAIIGLIVAVLALLVAVLTLAFDVFRAPAEDSANATITAIEGKQIELLATLVAVTNNDERAALEATIADLENKRRTLKTNLPAGTPAETVTLSDDTPPLPVEPAVPEPTLVEIPGPTPLPAEARIVFQSNRDGDYELFIMDAGGDGQLQLTSNDTADKFPAVSPDGSQVAFQCLPDENWEICVLDLKRELQRQLTFDEGRDELPTWSPDGSQLAFISNRDGDFDLFVLNADGTGLRQVTLMDHQVGHCSWSIDDLLVCNVGALDHKTWEITVINPNTGEQSVLTQNEVSDWSPEWSPDGKSIVYLSEPFDGRPSIYSMNADGSEQRLLHTSEHYVWAPRWSASGDEIMFTVSTSDIDYIYIMDADGGNPRQLAARASYPSWAK